MDQSVSKLKTAVERARKPPKNNMGMITGAGLHVAAFEKQALEMSLEECLTKVRQKTLPKTGSRTVDLCYAKNTVQEAPGFSAMVPRDNAGRQT